MARPRSKQQQKSDGANTAEIQKIMERMSRSRQRESTTKSELDKSDSFRDSDDIAYAVGRIINQGQVADGPTLPRPVRGEFRVPFPSGFKISGTPSTSFGGTVFTLKWNDCNDPYVSRYNVYVRNALDENVQPALLGVSQRSPFTARVTSDAATTVIFYLQTVMNNGQALPVNRCPTCTGTVPAPVISPSSIPDHAITNAKLAQGPATGALITFDDIGSGPDATYIAAPFVPGLVLTAGASGSIPLWGFPAAFRITLVLTASEINDLNDTPILFIQNTLGISFQILSVSQQYNADTIAFTNYGGESRLAVTYDIDGPSVLAVPLTSDKFTTLDSFNAFFGTPGTLQGPDSDFRTKDMYIQWDPSATGRVVTASVDVGGAGYAPGDTGTSSDPDPWTYTVNTVTGGAVTTFTVNAAGTQIAKGASTTTATSGGGSGFIASIDSIQTLGGGDGLYRVTALYTFLF